MKRQAGVLLHISSLPSKYGIGTLGKEAYEFVDFLYNSNFHIWQILPLTLTSYGDSPYQSPSSKALNPYFIDLEFLISDGLLTVEECDSIKWNDDEKRVNYEILFNNRYKVLKKAFNRFKKDNEDYIKFINANEFLDFAVFMTLKEVHNFRPWNEWEDEYKFYNDNIIDLIKEKYSLSVEFYEWTQYIFLKQFNNLKDYAHKHDVKIMGDMPIYLSYDSVEVWKNPEYFQLDEKHNPTRVAGCPPDCFSEDGQLWGNPLYNWDYMKKENYKWWNDRINYNLSLYDLVRIDHFRGFSGYYSIPYGDKTAKNGKWIKGPGADLFLDKLDYPIIAEDLGMMDEDFYKMMDVVKYPGMKIVMQGFDGDPKSIWKPSNYTENFFSYTTTHDSTTARQFYDDLNDEQKEIFINDLISECKLANVAVPSKNDEPSVFISKIIEINLFNKAKVSMFAMQDLLDIGKEGRMNFPSTLSTDNWSWRLTKNYSLKEVEEKMKNLIKQSNRN